jgi:hypothetical protein
MFGWFKPKFPKLETVNITRQELREQLISLGFRGDWGYMDLSADPEYRVPTLENLKDIIWYDSSDSKQYIKASRDCDDFARIFLGNLSAEGHGDLAIGWIKGWLVYPEKEVYHKMCWGMTQQGLYIFEPQQDSYIWKHGERVKWGLRVTGFKPNTMGI